jgi:Lipase (class 3)
LSIWDYSGGTIPNGYTRVQGLDSLSLLGSRANDLGVAASVYLGPNNQAVVVFTGTDGNNPEIIGGQLRADGQIINGATQNPTLNLATVYLKEALTAINADFPGVDVTITGHSLGGSEADFSLAKSQTLIDQLGLNVSTVAFDPAGFALGLLPQNFASLDAINISAFADPATGVTLARGYQLPGQVTYAGVRPPLEWPRFNN